jgi:hypothetical protein
MRRGIDEIKSLIPNPMDLYNLAKSVISGDLSFKDLAMSMLEGMVEDFRYVATHIKVLKPEAWSSYSNKEVNDMGYYMTGATITVVKTTVSFLTGGAGAAGITAKFVDILSKSKFGAKIVDKAADAAKLAKQIEKKVDDIKDVTGVKKVEDAIDAAKDKIKKGNKSSTGHKKKPVDMEENIQTCDGGGVNCCFTGETEVKTASGDKEIEDIKVGDQVYAENPYTGEKGYREVKNKIELESYKLYHIKLDEEEIETTAPHPFYVDGKGWTPADELKVGDKVKLASGKFVEIDEIVVEELDKPVKVYNLEVEGLHTYFVSDLGLLVHNTGNSTCSVKNNVPENVVQYEKMKEYMRDNKSMLPYREQIEPGSSDLSIMAIKYRSKMKNPRSQKNIAIAEIEVNGQISHIPAVSGGKYGHSENAIIQELTNNGIDPKNIKRLYSERQPCGPNKSNCDKLLATHAPSAKVTYSFEFGDDSSILRGNKAHSEYTNDVANGVYDALIND